MKKQFFYAVMALAVMSSCSKDNDPGNGNPEENNDKAVIALGVDVPTATVSTRGTGSVGDVAGDQNTWNSQKLYIYMVDRATGLEAEEGADGAKTKILNNDVLQFRAPKADAQDKGSIRIYKSYTEDTDNGVIQYKYYPTNGQYTFYGYHIDDAENATPNITATEKKVTGVTINGTQDLLAAKTIDMTANDAQTDGSFYKDIATTLTTEWSELMNYQFGARTARKGIVPVLKFEHQLARLKFFVRAGSQSAAGYEYQGGWTERKSNDAAAKTLGMQVTKITLKDMANVIDMDLTTPVSTRNGAGAADFVVCSKDAANNNKLDPTKGLITPVVPKYPYGDSNIPDASTDPDAKGTQVGEPVMFFPNGDIELSIDLKQYVEDTQDETNGNTISYKEVEKADNKLTIEEAKISADTKEFKPGASYNVYITIYGFEKIEVTAVLTAWENGGDIDADIEDGK